MPCECHNLPSIVAIDQHPVLKQYDVLETSEWTRLVCCPDCKQLWVLDGYEQGLREMAIKIPKRDGWQDFDTMPLRRQYLVESRGGLTGEKYIWQGCDQRRVKGVFYCADHLYETGARE